jgi:dihydroneopterin aldolase/2-amino-4-hydroxy-6-hydroxymethyldihydropteridine diphosphokinase
MTQLLIQNMEVFGYHGVSPSETKNGQRFLLSIQAEIMQNIAQGDAIENTVSYADLYALALSIAENNTFQLLETLAQAIIDAALDKFLDIVAITVNIQKPDAPIVGTFDSVGIAMTKQRSNAYLSLGSNVGDKKKNIDSAVLRLCDTFGVLVLTVSPLYITSPVGYANQDNFLNCCVKLATTLSPHELLNETAKIEQSLKRKRSFSNGPRTIDIDLLVFNSQIIHTPKLTLPHPRILERKFVLVPLLDIYDSDINILFTLRRMLLDLQKNDDSVLRYEE